VRIIALDRDDRRRKEKKSKKKKKEQLSLRRKLDEIVGKAGRAEE